MVSGKDSQLLVLSQFSSLKDNTQANVSFLRLLALELQYIKFLFESSEEGAKAACQTILEDSDAKDDFLNLINGDLNLFNLDSKRESARFQSTAHFLSF